MAQDKRDQLYDNLIGSGKVTENEIGNREEFKAAIKDEDSSRQFYKNILGSGLLSEKELGDEDMFYNSISSDFAPAKPAGYQPTPEDMASFQSTIRSGQRTLAAIPNIQQGINKVEQRAKQRAGLRVPQRINIGETNNLKEEQHLNPETGELEKTYITEGLHEYGDKAMAEQEQQKYDEQTRMIQWRKDHPQEALLQDIDGQTQKLDSMLEKQEIDWIDQDGRIHYKGGRTSDEAVETIKQAKQDLDEARTRLERSQQLESSSDFLGGIGIPFTKDWFNNWKNFGYGIWDTLHDPSLYDFGLSDLQKAGMYLKIKDKIEKGEELTDQETALALAGMANAQAQQIAVLPHGYTAGATTMEMAPFMIQMAMNPASGTGRALARQAVRKFGRDGIKAVSARMGARVLGNIAEGAALSNTLQAGSTAANIMQRYTGDTFQYSDDGKRIVLGHYEDGPDGEPVFVEGGKGLARSIWEGEVSSIIENVTELGAGGNINKFLGKMATSKAGRAIGLGYINDLVGKIGATPFARNMKKFMERTHWDGLIEEPLEEEYGIILNSLLTGDNKISDLWDSEQQADIFAGTMWFGGFMAGMNTAAYPVFKRKIKREVQRADLAGQQAFGDEWETMKAGVEEMDDKQLVQYLYSIKDNDSFNNDQKAALFAYASRLKQQQGANTADMLMRMEGNLTKEETNIRNAYDRGMEMKEPQDMNEAKMNLDIQYQRLSEMFKDYKLILEEFEKNPMGALNGFINNDHWTPEEKQIATDYVNARTTYEGMLDGVRDDIEGKIEVSNATIDKRSNPNDGMVHPATLKDDKQVYIVGGNVVMDEAGTNVDVEASMQATGGDNMILTVDAETGKVEAHDINEFMTVDQPTDANQLKAEAAENIRQTTAQEAADKIDGKLAFQPGDQYQIIDEQGGEHSVQIVLNNGDGTVMATIDGTAEPIPMAMQDVQTMADAYNQAKVMQQQAEIQAERNAESASLAEENNSEGLAEQQTEEPEQQPTALDRIPVVSNEKGEPIFNKRGEKTYLWHQAPVADTADALAEMTGDDMLMARDTAASMIDNAKQDLEKANKLKPQGRDPQSIINSRKNIAATQQQARDVVKYWQDVQSEINRRMKQAEADRIAAEQAAKTEEQRAAEAQRQAEIAAKQAEIDAQRRAAELEKQRKERNKPYAPLQRAKKDLEGYDEALEVLNDTEPRDLAEWVSYLLRPHSLMWEDEKVGDNTMTGLQSELGLQKKDFDRIGTLLGKRKDGAMPFAEVVDEIHEGLPEAMKEQYTDQDVRNALIDLFGEGDVNRMLHLAEEHRIEEAQQMRQEIDRRDQEAELDAWADAYHLTPEERESFEEFMQEPPSEVELEVINQIIAEHESDRSSERMDSQPDNGANAEAVEAGEGQVQQTTETTDEGAVEQAPVASAETVADEQTPADNTVFGIRKVDAEFAARLRANLTNAYASGDATAIKHAVDAIKSYVDVGGDFEGSYSEEADDYTGTDPEMLTEQYITHLLLDRYLDDDEDQEYIRTGLRKDLRENSQVREQNIPNEGINDSQLGNNQSTLTEQEFADTVSDILDDLENGILDYQDVVDTTRELVDMLPNGEVKEMLDRAYQEYDSKSRRSKERKDTVDDATNKLVNTIRKAANMTKPLDSIVQFGVPYISNLTEPNSEITFNGVSINKITGEKEYHGTQRNSLYNNVIKLSIREKDLKDHLDKGVYTQKADKQPQQLGETSSPEEIAAEEAKVNTEPTEGQKKAGNYQMGHIKVDGFDVTIENPKGSTRSGVDQNGKEWSQEMHNTYGYIRGTEGVDGDHIDVFLSDYPDEGYIYVIDQVNPETGEFDEHKVMYGFDSVEDATEAYLSNYEEGWKGLGNINRVERSEFKKWVDSSHRKTKPFAEYKSVKKDEYTEAGEGVKTVDTLDIPAEVKDQIAEFEGILDDILKLPVVPEDEETKNKLEKLKAKLSEARRKLNIALRTLTTKQLLELKDATKDNAGAVYSHATDEIRNRQIAQQLSDTYDAGAEKQGEITGKANGKQVKAEDYVTANEKQPALSGMYHDPDGYGVVSDDYVLLADKKAYDKTHKGETLTLGKDAGKKIDGDYPNWKKIARDNTEGYQKAKINVDKLLDFLAGVEDKLKAQWKAEKEAKQTKMSYKDWSSYAEVFVKMPDGTVISFRPHYLKLFAQGMKQIGTSEIEYLNIYNKVLATSKNGVSLVMPLARYDTWSQEEDVHRYFYDLSEGKAKSKSKLNFGPEEQESEQEQVPLQKRPMKSSVRSDGSRVEGIEEYEENLKLLRDRLDVDSATANNTGSGADMANQGDSSGQVSEGGLEGAARKDGIGGSGRSIDRLREKFGTVEEVDRELEAIQKEKERRQIEWEAFKKKYHVARDGRISTEDYLRAFNDLNTDAENKRLMDRVVKTLKGKLGVLNFVAGMKDRGGWLPSLNEISISQDWITRGVDNNQKAKTMLHELLHKVTSDSLFLYNIPLVRHAMSKEMREACKTLYAIHDALKRAYPKLYASTKVREMVAEMGSPIVRGALNSIDYDANAKVTWWDKFVEAIKTLIGMGTKSDMRKGAYWDSRAALDKLFDAKIGRNRMVALPFRWMKAKLEGELEEEKTLMGVHNIPEYKLRKVLKQGGLANPSMAVVDTKNHIHTDYGEISLIPRSSLIDARKGRNAGTFTADAWTATYPQVMKKMTNKGWDTFYKDTREIQNYKEGGEEMFSKIRMAWDSYLDGRDPSELYWWYLLDRGYKPEAVRYQNEYGADLTKEVTQLATDENGSDIDVASLPDEAIKRLAELKRQYEMQQGEEKSPVEERIAKARASMEGKNEVFRANRQKWIDQLEKYGDTLGNLTSWVSKVVWAGRREGLLDVYGTTRQAQKEVQKDHASDYQAWLLEKEGKYGVEEKLFAGTDNYTGRQKWIPNTLANASKLMKKQGLNGAVGWSSLGEWIAKVAKRVTTLPEIRKERKNLNTTREQHDAFKEKWGKTLHEIATKLSVDDDLWVAENRLTEALEHANPADYIQREYGINLPKKDRSAIDKFIKEVRENFPTGYFETKFQRPVYLNEFAVAVVPDTTSPDVIAALEREGLKITTYQMDQHGNPDDENRKQAVMKAVQDEDDILFRDDDDDDVEPQNDVFYSNAQRAVENVAQDKATPEQWIKMIEKQGGFKAGEDNWLGLRDWLQTAADEGVKTVNKLQILDYIRENQIPVEEVTYSEYFDLDNVPKMIEFRKEYKDLLSKYEEDKNAVWRDSEEFNEEMYKKYGEGWANKQLDEEDKKRSAEISHRFNMLNDNDLEQLAFADMVDKHGDDFSMAFEIDYGSGTIDAQEDMYGDGLSDAARHYLEFDERPINGTRLNYTTQGLDNKKEIAITVPTIEPYNSGDEIHFGDAGEGRAVVWVRFGDTTISREPTDEELAERISKMPTANQWEKVDGSNFVVKKDIYFMPGTRTQTNHSYIVDNGDGTFEIGGPMARRMTTTKFPSLEEAVYAYNKEWVRGRSNSFREKVLVIDEIQSKRHQDARDKGYSEAEDIRKKHGWIIEDDPYDPKIFNSNGERLTTNPDMAGEKDGNHTFVLATDEEWQDVLRYFREKRHGVPSAPFEKNWHEVAMKRMLRYAAEHGYDKIAWTTGQQQAERYDLGNVIQEIYTFEPDDYAKEHGEFLNIELVPTGNGEPFFVNVDKEGKIMSSDVDEFRDKNLGDVVGKELAVKLMSAEPGSTIKADDLHIGGEGMKGFYDEMLPRFMNKYGKKWGVKVSTVHLPDLEKGAENMWSVDITPEMRESVMEGQPLFRLDDLEMNPRTTGEDMPWEEEENNPIFYSNALKAVEAIKQDKATPEQWLAMIQKQGGLKAGEDKWIGLSDWLSDQKEAGVKSLNKQQLLQYIRSNQIRIDETHYGDTMFSPNSMINLESEIQKSLYDGGTVEDALRQWDKEFGDTKLQEYQQGRFTVDEKGRIHTEEELMKPIENTRKSFTTKGLSEKKEIALTVPTIEPYKQTDRIHFGDAGEGRAVAWIRFGETPYWSEESSVTEAREALKVLNDKYDGQLVRNPDMTEEEKKQVKDLNKTLLRGKQGYKRALVIDEIQSKRHQEGREQGYEGEYKNSPRGQYDEAHDKLVSFNKEMEKKYGEYFVQDDMTKEELATYNKLYDDTIKKSVIIDDKTYHVPDAPFEKNWHELAMKRMLRYAAEHGFDKIAWTTGQQQADRYNLSKVIRSIRNSSSVMGAPNWYTLVPQGGAQFRIHVGENGKIDKVNTSGYGTLLDHTLTELFGKEAAPKIEALKDNEAIDFENQTIGGEGMKGFYDEILPRFLNKYGKKWGVKVEKTTFPRLGYGGKTMWSIDVTPEMRESVLKGQPMFRTSDQLNAEYGNRWLTEQTNDDGRHTTQVKNTIKSYEKFGNWVKKDSNGKDVTVLDASSGLGLGTEWMRENGLNVDDVEPYPSENRQQPTYQSYSDIDKKYDYIISNAVLNVIPDDWRANLLHDMADKLKVGGKMVINVRSAESIKQQGTEGKTRITLDDPSEILVLRPDGSIKAYQKGFTKQELKQWCEEQLGDGYTVETANTANAGGTYDTAVVIEKNRSSERGRTQLQAAPSSGELNQSGGVRQSHVAPTQTNSVANVQNNTVNSKAKLKKFINSGYLLDKTDTTSPNDLVRGLAKAIGLRRSFSSNSYYNLYDVNGDKVSIRLSTHPANGENMNKEQADERYSFVVYKDGSHSKDGSVHWIEYTFNPKESSAEDIVKGITNAVNDILNGRDESVDNNLATRKEYNASVESLMRQTQEQEPQQKVEKKRTPAEQRSRAAFAQRQRRRAVDLAKETVEKLNLGDKVTILDNADGLSGRYKKAKGWFDRATGKIVIVIDNHNSPTDVLKTILHEGVAHYGLRKLFGKNFDQFLKNVYEHSTFDIKVEIADMAARLRARDHKYGRTIKSNEQYQMDATEEFLAKLAEDTDFERAMNQGWWQQIKQWFIDMCRKVGLADFEGELTDNELRYILWRSYQNLAEPGRFKNMFQEAEAIAKDEEMKRKLGIRREKERDRLQQTGKTDTRKVAAEAAEPKTDLFRDDEEEDDEENDEDNIMNFNAGKPTLEETIISGLMKLARENSDNVQLRIDAMKAIGGNLSKLRQAMSKQRAYDKETVYQIVRLARSIMDNGYIDKLTRGEVKKLMGLIAGAAGKEDITTAAKKVVDMLVGNQLRQVKELLQKQLAIRGTKIDSKGVEVQGQLDIEGVRMARALKEGMTLTEEALAERIDDCLDRMGSTDDTISQQAAAEYQGYTLAQQYIDEIRRSESEEANLKYEKKRAREDYDAGRLTKEQYREFVESIDDTILSNQLERIKGYYDLLTNIGDILSRSTKRAREFREKEIAHVREIQHNANSDMEGRAYDEHHKPTWIEKAANWPFVRFFMKPLATFDQMLRLFGSKSVNGEGYLWNRFMNGYTEASDKEWRNLYQDYKDLDKKVSEVFGKNMKWSDLFSIERKMPGMKVEFWDGGERKEHTLTPGNLLYIYMANKMADGRMKLRKMGITEDDVNTIKEHLDPRFIELADWLQNEYLPEKRVYFNSVHEDLFGASMAAIDNYFPLVINKRDLNREEEVGSEDYLGDDKIGATITGNIIKRTKNAKALDITNADAFDVILQHLQQMEHWAAYAAMNKDLGALLSYKHFRNQVLNMKSLQYGSGQNLWVNFKRACAVVSGAYRPKIDKDSVDTSLVNLAKGVTAAKISLRVFTALKQLLSYPAYLSEASLIELAKYTNPVGAVVAFNWAMDNLPGFSKRWQSRIAGDTRLQDTDVDWGFWKNKIVKAAGKIGMLPNAFIDAITVSMGAKAIYETKKKQYLADGYSEEQADKKALNAASISFNETQQSSEQAFISAMQLDRTVASVALTVFRNASMGYQRRLTAAIRNLQHMMTPGYRQRSIEFMAKQMQREGLTEHQAERAAKRTYNRSWYKNIADVVIFGFVMQLAWNLGPYLPYLIGGDDDDEKNKMLEDAMMHALAGSVEGLTLGAQMSEIYNIIRSGGDISSYQFNLLPLMSDLQQTLRHFKSDEVAAWNDVINLLIQSGIGVNPQTLTDAFVAIQDAAEGDPETSKEIALLIMRIMQMPQSSIDKVMIDELGMTGEEAKKLDAEALARRWATYKRRKNAPLTGWAYRDEEEAEVEKKYVDKFTNKIKERFADKSETDLEAMKAGESDEFMKELIQKQLNKMTEATMDEQNIYMIESDFNSTHDPEKRKLMARRISKSTGASKDPYGGKSDKDYAQLYQELRNAEDVREDAELLKLQEDADAKGDNEKVDEISKERSAIRKNIQGMERGKTEANIEAMEDLRADRKELLKKYNIK